MSPEHPEGLKYCVLTWARLRGPGVWLWMFQFEVSAAYSEGDVREMVGHTSLDSGSGLSWRSEFGSCQSVGRFEALKLDRSPGE